MSALCANTMHDEAAAFAHVEAMLWATGPILSVLTVALRDRAYKLKGVRSRTRLAGPELKQDGAIGCE